MKILSFYKTFPIILFLILTLFSCEDKSKWIVKSVTILIDRKNKSFYIDTRKELQHYLRKKKINDKLTELKTNQLNQLTNGSERKENDLLFIVLYASNISLEDKLILKELSKDKKTIIWLVKEGLSTSPTLPDGIDAIASPSAEEPAVQKFKREITKKIDDILLRENESTSN